MKISADACRRQTLRCTELCAKKPDHLAYSGTSGDKSTEIPPQLIDRMQPKFGSVAFLAENGEEDVTNDPVVLEPFVLDTHVTRRLQF